MRALVVVLLFVACGQTESAANHGQPGSGGVAGGDAAAPDANAGEAGIDSGVSDSPADSADAGVDPIAWLREILPEADSSLYPIAITASESDVVLLAGFDGTVDFGDGSLTSGVFGSYAFVRLDGNTGQTISSHAVDISVYSFDPKLSARGDRVAMLSGGHLLDVYSAGFQPAWNVDLNVTGTIGADPQDEVAIDGLGNVYVLGELYDPASSKLEIEGNTIDGAQFRQFLLKFTSSGNLAWAMGVTPVDAMTVTSGGSMFLQATHFSGDTEPSWSHANIDGPVPVDLDCEQFACELVVGLDTNGKRIWAHANVKLTSYVASDAFVLDAANDRAFAYGHDPSSPELAASVRVFEANGTESWTYTLPSLLLAATSPSGEARAVIQHSGGPIDLGDGPLPYPSGVDFYAVAVSPTGKFAWKRKFANTTSPNVSLLGVASPADAGPVVALTLFSSNSITIGTKKLVSNDNGKIVVVGITP